MTKGYQLTSYSSKVVLIMFYLNLVNHPMFFLLSCCPTGIIWDTSLTHRGTQGRYLNHSYSHSDPCREGGLVVVVAHDISVTAQRPKSPFLFLDLLLGIWGLGLWTGILPWACQFLSEMGSWPSLHLASCVQRFIIPSLILTTTLFTTFNFAEILYNDINVH